MSKTPELDEDILRAAEILEREAASIRKSHALPCRLLRWPEEHASARADYAEMRRIARRLRRMVGTL